jgi:hypothetical protein
MNELVTLITQKTGLSNEMAQQCLSIVEGYCKDRVPEPMASQISSVLGGQVSASSPTSTTGDANQAANQGKGFLGNLFGGKSENQPTP